MTEQVVLSCFVKSSPSVYAYFYLIFSDGWDWPEQATEIESRLIGKIFAVSTNPVEAEDLSSGIF